MAAWLSPSLFDCCGAIIAFGVQQIRSNENKNCKEKDIFQCVRHFFVKHDLDIQSIGFAFTDGGPAMLGNNSGFFALLKHKIPHL